MVLSDGYYTTAVVFGGTFAVSYLIVWIRGSFFKPKHRYPPCLPWVPIIGSMPFLPRFPQMYSFFTTRKHGGVVGFYLTDQYTVILNGKEAIHDAFVKHGVDFADRPPFYSDKLMKSTRKGLLVHPFNDNFKKYHKLTLAILKKFGFGSRIMENRISIEVDELVSRIKSFDGKPFCPSEMLTNCTMNVIASIIFGKRFEQSDPRLEGIISNIRKTFREFVDLIIMNFFPFLRFFPRFKRAVQKNIDLKNDTFRILEESIQKSLADEMENSFIRCFIDEEGPENYDHEQLLATLNDLFKAGTETTATSLEWAIAIFANHQDVQERFREELESVVPNDRLPSLTDRPSLPYVEATLFELMRYKPVAPLGVPHMTMCDTEVCGYFIPANITVFANIYSALMDPDTWTDPEEFRPARFLDDTGSVINKDSVINFSLGKRSCTGEMLARQELFLFITALVQQFLILPPEGQNSIVCKDVMDVTLKPSAYQVRLVKRF